jgi:hypothetical protein
MSGFFEPRLIAMLVITFIMENYQEYAAEFTKRSRDRSTFYDWIQSDLRAVPDLWTAASADGVGAGRFSNVAHAVDPLLEAWEPVLAAKPVTETNSHQITDVPQYTDQARTIAAALWPLFTCCDYCAGSVEAPDAAERREEVLATAIPGR